MRTGMFGKFVDGIKKRNEASPSDAQVADIKTETKRAMRTGRGASMLAPPTAEPNTGYKRLLS